jgi:formylglycine-generating enzyme required for sulfatase activity
MNEADSRPGAAEDRQALAPGTRIGDRYLVLKAAEPGSAALSYEGLRLADQTSVTLFEFFPRGLAVRSDGARVAAIRGWEADFDAALERFGRRADAIAALHAEAVAKPLDRIEDLGTLYHVTESSAVPTLSGWASDLLRRPSDADLASLALRIGEALRALHHAGEGHGAISNSQLHVPTPERAFLSGALLETSAVETTASADIRALAAVFYAVVTGRAPPPENRDRSLDARFASRHMAAGDYSEALLELIDGALEFGEDAPNVQPAAWLDSMIAVSRGILGDKVPEAPKSPPAQVQSTPKAGAGGVPKLKRERPSANAETPGPEAGQAGARRKSSVLFVGAVAVVLVAIAGWLAYLLLGQTPGSPPAPQVAVQKATPPAAPAPKPEPERAASPSEPRAQESQSPPQVVVVLPELPPIPPPPSRPVVTAEEIAQAATREAVLALGERGAAREAVIARLAALGFEAVAASGETVFRKAAAGESWRDCSICPELVLVPAGTTSMQITIGDKTQQLGFRFDRSLAVAKFEVTRAQYAAFVRETSRVTTGGCHARTPAWGINPALNWENPGFVQTDRDPVVCVSFQDALAYTEWLSARTGQRYRLPTDAEWHYLATAEKWNERQPNQLCTIGNGADLSARAGNPDWQHAACDDSAATTAPVGKYAAGPWGLHDLNGNVWEWVATCAPEPHADAEFPPRACPAGAPRLLRGGSWADAPKLRQLDSRVISAPNVRDQVAGFRVVREP